MIGPLADLLVTFGVHDRPAPPPAAKPSPPPSAPNETHRLLQQIVALDARVATLTAALQAAQDLAKLADQERVAFAEQMRALAIVNAGNSAARELARVRRTLLEYEDQLATCREQHGANTRSGRQVPE